MFNDLPCLSLHFELVSRQICKESHGEPSVRMVKQTNKQKQFQAPELVKRGWMGKSPNKPWRLHSLQKSSIFWGIFQQTMFDNSRELDHHFFRVNLEVQFQ
jgi:hypothetical protein